MAKFYGRIGYAESKEVRPGVWKDNVVERMYSGELIRNTGNFLSSDNANDNIKVSNIISIVSDPYANMNCHAMRYVEFMGALWKIEKVEAQYPRLILTIGGVYNGPQA